MWPFSRRARELAAFASERGLSLVRREPLLVRGPGVELRVEPMQLGRNPPQLATLVVVGDGPIASARALPFESVPASLQAALLALLEEASGGRAGPTNVAIHRTDRALRLVLFWPLDAQSQLGRAVDLAEEVMAATAPA